MSCRLPFTFLLYFLIIPNLILCEITETNDASVIVSILQEAQANDLVIFDVDDVLFEPTDAVMQRQNRSFLCDQVAVYKDKLTNEEFECRLSQLWLQRPIQVIDEKIVTLIENLQCKNIRVAALTNCFTQSYGQIESMEKWRQSELHQQGYYLEKSWPDISSYVFDQILSTNTTNIIQTSLRPAVFYEGILQTSGCTKGELLKAFLIYSKLKPEKIYFVDDKLSMLESVQETANEFGIKFQGIHFTAVETKNTKGLDIEKATYQINTLFETGLWICD